MEDFKKSGYTADGRKLRPRRPRVSTSNTERAVYSSSNADRTPRTGEGRPYGEGRRPASENRYHNDGRRPSSEGRNYSERPQRRSYGAPEGEHRSFHKPFDGERKPRYGEGASHDARRSYGEGSERPQRRPYGAPDGERRSFRKPTEGRPRYGEGSERPQRRPAEGGARPMRKSFDNKPRTGKPGFAKKPFGKPGDKRGGKGPGKPFFKFDDRNIDKMLSTRPQISDMELSDNDMAPTEISDTIRLNKYIANSGVCSRREADQYIQAGVVTVNGEVVTELGVKVNVLTDEVKFNGERLRGEEKVYIVMNKPRGYVTTASDPHAEKTVMDLMKDCRARVFPVGRLDKNTTGVLMFTNDGEIAEKLTHPSYDKKKIYQVILDRPLAQEDFDKVLSGIDMNDGQIKADDLEYIDEHDHKKLGIEIHSGKNRIVRRIFESLGYEVMALDRVYFAGVTKKGLKRGEWRYLTAGEANVLRMGAYV